MNNLERVTKLHLECERHLQLQLMYFSELLGMIDKCKLIESKLNH